MLPISCRSSAGQGKAAGQRPHVLHQPTRILTLTEIKAQSAIITKGKAQSDNVTTEVKPKAKCQLLQLRAAGVLHSFIGNQATFVLT